MSEKRQEKKATDTRPGKSRDFCGVEYYDVARAADFIGFSPSTLKRETAGGRISSLKMGRDIWYKPAWLTDYIEERTRIGVYRQQ